MLHYNSLILSFSPKRYLNLLFITYIFIHIFLVNLHLGKLLQPIKNPFLPFLCSRLPPHRGQISIFCDDLPFLIFLFILLTCSFLISFESTLLLAKELCISFTSCIDRVLSLYLLISFKRSLV